MDEVRVPQDRVGAIIGKNGEIKRAIQERSGVVLSVDSETGEVFLDKSKAKDSLIVMKVEEVVKALARGFAPEHAFKLLDDDVYLEIMDIHDYVGKDQSHIRRMKARIIGKNGKTRRIIESMTGAYLCIYGGTVAIIGDVDGFDVAKKAVDMVLSGSEHATVYKFLERKRRESKLARLDSIVNIQSEPGMDELDEFKDLEDKDDSEE
jgi:ribosomal RNA assembly protein